MEDRGGEGKESVRVSACREREEQWGKGGV